MPVLRELDRAECERLLRRGTIGRLALCSRGGPDIVPVNYVVDGDSVVVRTTPDGLLARHGDGQRLALEVDLVDHERWHGWSVVARGTGELVAAPSSGVLGAPRPRPWADGDRTAELRLRWTELTGRSLGTVRDQEAGAYPQRPTR